MIWKELVKNALLGVENSSFTDPTLEAMANYGLDTTKAGPLLLADAAAMLSQLRRAGFLLHPFQGELPAPSQAHDLQSASPEVDRYLHLMLAGRHLDVLPELLELLKTAGKYLPTSELPALMRLPELTKHWPQIAPLLGDSGRWLLRQHPDWSALIPAPESLDWHTGSRSERLQLFQCWRDESPTYAMEQLSSTWEGEAPMDKVAFLGLSQVGLSGADASYLERFLDDRRKEVRQAAAPLLARISNSELAQRMTKRAADLFKWQGNRLKINLLSELDAGALRDGILQPHPGWPGGPMAAHLGQVVSMVPPSHWEAYFSRTPAEVLNLFLSTDWGEPILRGIVEATVLHRNQDWAMALFVHWQKTEFLPVWKLPVALQLAALLATEMRDKLALRFMGETDRLPPESSPLFKLLKHSTGAWTNELSLAIVHRFRAEINQDYRQRWQVQHLIDYLQMLGLRCQPSILDELQAGWNMETLQWRTWEKPVGEMLAKVLFRKELREAIVESK